MSPGRHRSLFYSYTSSNKLRIIYCFRCYSNLKCATHSSSSRHPQVVKQRENEHTRHRLHNRPKMNPFKRYGWFALCHFHPKGFTNAMK
ncbi:hypothetical protein OUZ56_027903 [Daphnia magna]|uniref:Uncharacterized protein n=1 Tax=Daphnia magna TaxID=35525 RepID=A0ABR0B2A0_9CRUS|nr:hypothetical protein OUZ56_027903 [Daphnia magna]